MAGGSSLAVYSAILGNSVVMVAKTIAFVFTGSSAMLSEAIHSFADVSNQCLLALGIQRSKKHADKLHPYGYVRERYIWALISAVGIFFLGCGVTIYHGITSLIHPHQVESFSLAFYILLFAFVVEGLTLFVAIKAVNQESKLLKLSFFSYLRHGTDPTGVAVILEDGAAVLGVLIAAGGLWLSYVTGDSSWDAYATITIGLLLGTVAIFLTYRTRGLLIGQSIPHVSRQKIMNILRSDPVVAQIFDVKTAIMGVEDLRFKAEIMFDGEAIAERYLSNEGHSMSDTDLKSRESRRKFLVTYGSHLIESLGEEINRIEEKLKKEVPQLKHIDLEVN